MVAKPLIDTLSALTVEQRFEVLDWLQHNLETSDIPEAHRVILDSRLKADYASISEPELRRDIAAMRQSMIEIDQGKGISIDDLHTRLRSELLAMKAPQNVEK